MADFEGHKDTCFFTLTYEDSFLPSHGSLKHSDFSAFMKRLRKESGIEGMKYLMCGEYGETNGRAHYHAVLRGLPATRSTASLIKKSWNRGRVHVGECNFNSVSYTSGYILKSKLIQESFDGVTSFSRQKPEYCRTSIHMGKEFFTKKKYEMIRLGYVLFHGKKHKIPRCVYDWNIFTEPAGS